MENRSIIKMEDPTLKEKYPEAVMKAVGLANVSYFKYGPARDNFASGRVDAIGSLELCLDKFKKTKNTEYLLDVVNYAIYRVIFPLPGDEFKHTDSDGSAGTVGTPINME